MDENKLLEYRIDYCPKICIINSSHKLCMWSCIIIIKIWNYKRILFPLLSQKGLGPEKMLMHSKMLEENIELQFFMGC